MDFTFRPIGADWLQDRTSAYARRRSPFKASHSATLELLRRELHQLNAGRVVIQIDLREEDIRLDGLPRSNARVPEFPGVILSFESAYGPLRYQTDVFTRWEDNLRAIALGLESLRRVDRYGITKRGEQYAGWKALPRGSEPSVERGRELIREHGSVRNALMATHPDRGGDAEDFADVQAAREAGT